MLSLKLELKILSYLRNIHLYSEPKMTIVKTTGKSLNSQRFEVLKG